jgi:hypothetical protein
MSLQFKNIQGETFIVGLASFGFLDRNNVFDPFQEDNDEESEIILKTTGDKVIELADAIKTTVAGDSRLRDDLREKLNNLSEFVRNSNGIEVTIV